MTIQQDADSAMNSYSIKLAWYLRLLSIVLKIIYILYCMCMIRVSLGKLYFTGM